MFIPPRLTSDAMDPADGKIISVIVRGCVMNFHSGVFIV
jgi:hypothetical protein